MIGLTVMAIKCVIFAWSVSNKDTQCSVYIGRAHSRARLNSLPRTFNKLIER